jgi:hypothetical protein
VVVVEVVKGKEEVVTILKSGRKKRADCRSATEKYLISHVRSVQRCFVILGV